MKLSSGVCGIGLIDTRLFNAVSGLHSLFYYTILKINNGGNFPKKLNNFLGQSEMEAEAILVKLHKT